MPRTQLRLAAHSVRVGDAIIEVWYDGEFIAQVTTSEGPRIKVISKYEKTAAMIEPLMLEVRIGV